MNNQVIKMIKAIETFINQKKGDLTDYRLVIYYSDSEGWIYKIVTDMICASTLSIVLNDEIRKKESECSSWMFNYLMVEGFTICKKEEVEYNYLKFQKDYFENNYFMIKKAYDDLAKELNHKN